MKYLLILGRGIEGAGNTRNAIDYSKWLNENGHEARVIAYCDRAWGRTNAHEGVKDFKRFKLSKGIEDILPEIDWADRILMLSVPIKKSSDEVKDRFMETVRYASENGVTQAYFQLDHNLQSIHRNFYSDDRYYDFFQYMDIVFTHSLQNDFCEKFVKNNNIKLNKLIVRSDKISNVFGIDFDAMRSKYWVPYEEKERKSLRFIGRAAFWKGPWVVKDIHTKYLRKDGYITYLEGIESALHSIQYIFKSLHPRILDDNNISLLKYRADAKAVDDGTYPFGRDKPVYLLPPYNNHLCMGRLAHTEYGIELLFLKDYFLENTIENAMLEMVAVGAIPIFRKHWAEKFSVGGKTLAEWGEKETGTIFMDENNPEIAIKKMDAIAANKEFYDKMRENAYIFYKKYFDIGVVCKHLILEIDEVDYARKASKTESCCK